MQSEQINELAAALAIAQGQMTGAKKDSENPFYKSRYADLAANLEEGRKALPQNGLAVIQTTESVAEGQITLVTTLVHKSGQWIRGVLTMTPKDSTPQAAGSCLTYMRRYAYAAIVGLAQVDDDANAAQGTTAHRGDRSGRPDTSAVPAEEVAQYVEGFTNALIEANVTKVMELHNELRTQAEVYTAVSDKLSSKQRTDLRKIITENKAAA